jgi:16S rRNA processing protein RimM
MRAEDCFQLGYVTKPHGLKGEVSIFLDTDVPEYYQEMESVFVQIENKLVPFFIDTIEIRKDRAIVKFEGVDSLEEAESMRGMGLYLPADQLPTLDDKSFYYHEIEGFTAQDVHHGEIGVINTVYSSGPQDLFSILFNSKEILVPVHDDILVRINRDEKKVVLSLPEGLLDLYLNE